MVSEKPWRTETVLEFGAAQIVCLFLGLGAAALLQKAGVPGFAGEKDFGNILLGTLCFQGATWPLLLLFLRWHAVDWRSALGLRDPGVKRALFLAGTCAGVCLPLTWLLQQGSITVLTRIGWPPENQTAVDLLANVKHWWTGAYLGFFAVVLAPVAEEFIFRGVLYPWVKQLGWPRLAWFGGSAGFALIHFNAATFAPLFVLALALTWLYEKTDNLLAPITAHALFNAVNLVLLLLLNTAQT